MGSSSVAKIGAVEGASSTGPSSGGGVAVLAVAVSSSDIWAIHVLWAEQREHRLEGPKGKLREWENGNGESEGKRKLGEEKRRSCC